MGKLAADMTPEQREAKKAYMRMFRAKSSEAENAARRIRRARARARSAQSAAVQPCVDTTARAETALQPSAQETDSIPPPPAVLDVLLDIIARNFTAAPIDQIPAKEAIIAMQSAGASRDLYIPKLNAICRKYFGLKGYYVK
jgi:hypothetical protein